jgi:hypothetical protein
MQSISDARGQGKVARFVTVVTTTQSYIFSPKAPIVRTNVALLVASFGNLYVWPITRVQQILYSGYSAPVPLKSIPRVASTEADTVVEKVMSTVSKTVKQGSPSASMSNSSPLCSDCFVVFSGRRPKNGSDPSVHSEDPWHQNPDYVDWSDAAIAAVSSPSPALSMTEGTTRQLECSLDGLIDCGGGSVGSCNYWYSFCFYYGPIVFGGGGGNYTLTNDPAGCAIDASYCDITDGDMDNVLAYSDGGGGLYTHYPWTCQSGPDVNTISQGTQDGLPCSTWQIVQYIGEYCNQYNQTCSPLPSLPYLLDHIFVEDGSAGPSDEVQIPGAGHLYLHAFLLGNPAPYEALQGGSVFVGFNNKLVRAHFPQPTANSDPRYPLAVSVLNASAVYFALATEANTYDTYYPCCDPGYNLAFANSNTWAAALLEVSQPQDMGKIVFYLTLRSLQTDPRYPAGWSFYAPLEPYFIVPAGRFLLDKKQR